MEIEKKLTKTWNFFNKKLHVLFSIIYLWNLFYMSMLNFKNYFINQWGFSMPYILFYLMEFQDKKKEYYVFVITDWSKGYS